MQRPVAEAAGNAISAKTIDCVSFLEPYSGGSAWQRCE
jgi:hypothetical protein